jgi:hypothetical protein
MLLSLPGVVVPALNVNRNDYTPNHHFAESDIEASTCLYVFAKSR